MTTASLQITNITMTDQGAVSPGPGASPDECSGRGSLALLAAMRLASPSLPVGAFAYSQGLEFAVEAGWLTSADDTEQWLRGILTQGLGHLDIPLLARLYRALPDADRFSHWNHYVLAARESRELRQEERQLGRALRQMLLKLQQPVPPDEDISWLAMFAWASRQWQLNEADTCLAFAWSWLENQLAAAAKSVPIGQTDVQAILGRSLPLLVAVCTGSRALADDDIGGGLPGLAMASILHESQYSRLFRS